MYVVHEYSTEEQLHYINVDESHDSTYVMFTQLHNCSQILINKEL